MPSHHTSSRSLLPYLLVAGAAVCVACMMSRRAAHPHSAGDGPSRRVDRGSGKATGGGLAAISSKAAVEAEGLEDCDFVRPAGPETMRDPPRRTWDMADEASDESFPASDPPGNY